VRRVLSSGIYRCVVGWKSTYVSEEHITSIFRDEEVKQESLIDVCFMSYFLSLFFDPENVGEMFLRNDSWLSTDYTYPRREDSLQPPLRRPQIQHGDSVFVHHILISKNCPVAWFSYSVEFHEVWPINFYTIHAFRTEIRSRQTDRQTDRRT
jgi:hypothetical protein